MFTESAKLFIQAAVPVGLVPAASAIAAVAPDTEEFFTLLNHEKICGNPIGQKGRKGTPSSPSNKNHK